MIEEVNKGMVIEVELPAWLRKSEDLLSRRLAGEVKAQSKKAILLKGTVVIKESKTCLRCGRKITNPFSIRTGYGPTCSDIIGIPYGENLQGIDIDNLQEELKAKAEVEIWLPKSYLNIEEIKEDKSKMPKAEVEAKKKFFYLKTPYKFKDLCKAIKGRRWDKKKKAWKYPKSPFIAEEIYRKFNNKIELEYDNEFKAYLKAAQNIQKAQKFKEKPEEELPDVEHSKYPAWEHQKQAYNFAKHLPSAMLAMDMGTGKTKVTVDLIVNRGHDKTLVVCPTSVIEVWPEETEKHAGKDVIAVPLRKGSVAERTEKAKLEMRKAEARDIPVVIIINYEAVWREPFDKFAKKTDWDFMVCDESHRIKAPGGKQSRFCYNLGKTIPYKLCLTGTPMPHSPLDVYAQYRFLDPGVYGTSFNRFKNRYAVMGGYGGYEVLGYQNEPEMNRKFYSIAYKCESDEVLDLPEKVDLNRYCSLNNKAMKHYEEIENDFITQIEEEDVTALNALTKLLRLQQVTSGYLPDDEGEVHQIDTSKKELLSDIMQDLDSEEPIVIFARFRHDLNEIRKVCKENDRGYCELSGKENQLQEWKSGEYNVIGVQIKSGGVGVDLTRSRYALYYSMGFSLGDYQQSRARVHRPGQEKTTYFVHLTCENTVDEKVMKALGSKKEIIDYILDDLNQRAKEVM